MNIDKNIPMPVVSKATSEITLAVRQMEVGDSILLRNYKNRQGAIISCVANARKQQLPYTFTSALEGDGIRVWRKA